MEGVATLEVTVAGRTCTASSRLMGGWGMRERGGDYCCLKTCHPVSGMPRVLFFFKF